MMVRPMNLQRFSTERTEAPTRRRRTEARQRGQVATSRDASAAIASLGLFVALAVTGRGALATVAASMATTLAKLPHGSLTISAASSLGQRVVIWPLLGVLVPVAVLVAVGTLVVGLVQTGFAFTARGLTPDLNRLNPLQGAQRLLSRRSLLELGKAVLKIVVIGVAAYSALAGAWPQIFLLPAGDVGSDVGFLFNLGLAIGLRAGAAGLVLAAVDVILSRRQYEQSLRMTKEEVRREHREHEGLPELKRRIRQAQRRLSRRRMMSEVPRADVVVTNPTHYAVALGYDAERMAAPQVLAKGQGIVAQRIRAVALEHHVAVLERPALARSLFFGVEVGEWIPAALYQAVAEVLAFVYRQREGVGS